ncbi:hypothetical protein RBB78_10145 [Tunturiibacter empetritectus]|uniref:hypothetical protein n=1 Tax=Tunturiibacter empetritectus TaxID=3069691 RepID=UPI003D9B8F8B
MHGVERVVGVAQGQPSSWARMVAMSLSCGSEMWGRGLSGVTARASSARVEVRSIELEFEAA